ncbi:hypothetical protein C8Q70DRAFT_66143 [Cubamyces menziesii]|nr:hypothetical protein C8Q70DRAFT_66143 [Cubamyces menziesii]
MHAARYLLTQRQTSVVQSIRKYTTPPNAEGTRTLSPFFLELARKKVVFLVHIVVRPLIILAIVPRLLRLRIDRRRPATSSSRAVVVIFVHGRIRGGSGGGAGELFRGERLLEPRRAGTVRGEFLALGERRAEDVWVGAVQGACLGRREAAYAFPFSPRSRCRTAAMGRSKDEIKGSVAVNRRSWHSYSPDDAIRLVRPLVLGELAPHAPALALAFTVVVALVHRRLDLVVDLVPVHLV